MASPSYRRERGRCDLFIYGLGLRRKKDAKTLDVWFPHIRVSSEPDLVWSEFVSRLELDGSVLCEAVSEKSVKRFLEQSDEECFERILTIFFLTKKGVSEEYATSDLIFLGYRVGEKREIITGVESVEAAYFRLQMISQRVVLPNQISLKGLFPILPNLAWTNGGPMFPQDVPLERLKRWGSSSSLQITHLDKFPYLLDYHLPSGVRIADTAKVRLGAYLGEGCTVMPAGYVNFNAGAAGPSMIEGRISAGVFVDHHSDIGGGASIMGTLSGGNAVTIRIGPHCLLGANSGTGISLGTGCTIAAGLYIYAGMKISLLGRENEPVDLTGDRVASGKNIVKALDVSGRDYLLFIQDSQTGEVICKPNFKLIQLNEELHKNG